MAINGTSALGRCAHRIRRAPALTVAIVVVVLLAPALLLTHHPAPLALGRTQAIDAAIHAPEAKQVLAGAHWDSIAADPVDGQLDRVSFYEHDRIVSSIAVDRNRRAVHVADFRHEAVPFGNWIAYEPAMLVALAALFVLLAGVAPLRRVRNLDVAVALSLLGSVVLLQQRYVDASVLASVPGLTYLMIRSARVGLGPAPPAKPSRPLLRALMPGLDAARRVRLLRLLLAAVVMVFVMVGVSSPAAVDVIFAVMEGATKLLHGVLPYRHMPGDVVHGDTYPLLSYVLYTPIAAVAPVNSIWDSVDLALAASVLSALGAGWALLRSYAGPRPGRRRSPELEEPGLRAALIWLSFPPVLIIVSTGTTDVALGAMIVAAVLLWRRPGVSSGLLAAAVWFKLAPAVLVPIWLAPRRGRELVVAVVAMAAVSSAMLGVLVAVGGVAGVHAMLHAISYQFSRGSPQSLWAALGIGGVQPLGQACLLALVGAATVRLARDPGLAKDSTRLSALSAAILIGLQLSADYWAFLYLVWVLPLLCLSLLASPAAATVGAPAPAQPDLPALRPAYVR